MEITDTGTGIMVLNVDEVTTTVVCLICFDLSVEYINFIRSYFALTVVSQNESVQIQSKGAYDQPAVDRNKYSFVSVYSI